MYKKAIYTLRSNERLTPAVWRMTLEGDTQWITAPGQFVNVELDGCYLRRPISVCDWDERTITLIYKVVGEGTALMAGLRPGARLDLLTGLGNGFDVTKGSRRELLVGGGVGVPPLYNLAKRLLADGREVAVVLARQGRSRADTAQRLQPCRSRSARTWTYRTWSRRCRPSGWTRCCRRGR